MSADAPGQGAGHPAAPPPAAPRAGSRDKAAPHRTEPAGAGTRTPPASHLATRPSVEKDEAFPSRRSGSPPGAVDKGARRPGAPAPFSPFLPRGGPSPPASGPAAPAERGRHFVAPHGAERPPGRLHGRREGERGRRTRNPARRGGSAGRTKGCGHSRFCWAQAAAQSSSRSAAPQSGFMAQSGGGVRRGRGRVLRGAGGGDGAVRARRRTDVSRPTGSAGGGGCAAPSRLRLHLGRAGGGGGSSSSSPAGRAVKPPPPPPLPGRNWTGQGGSRVPPPLPAQMETLPAGWEGGAAARGWVAVRGAPRCGRSR